MAKDECRAFVLLRKFPRKTMQRSKGKQNSRVVMGLSCSERAQECHLSGHTEWQGAAARLSTDEGLGGKENASPTKSKHPPSRQEPHTLGSGVWGNLELNCVWKKDNYWIGIDVSFLTHTLRMLGCAFWKECPPPKESQQNCNGAPCASKGSERKSRRTNSDSEEVGLSPVGQAWSNGSTPALNVGRIHFFS